MTTNVTVKDYVVFMDNIDAAIPVIIMAAHNQITAPRITEDATSNDQKVVLMLKLASTTLRETVGYTDTDVPSPKNNWKGLEVSRNTVVVLMECVSMLTDVFAKEFRSDFDYVEEDDELEVEYESIDKVVRVIDMIEEKIHFFSNRKTLDPSEV